MNKLAIVTGSTKGIGLALTKQLLALNMMVIGVGRSLDDETRQLMSRYCTYHYLQLDLLDPQTARIIYDTIIDVYGRIDYIIYNAGILSLKPIQKHDCSTMYELMQVNVFSFIELTRLSLRQLRLNNGIVIGISSGAAVKTYTGMSGYCMTKAAMNSFISSLGTEEDKFTSLAVRPGVVDTNMQAMIREGGVDIMDPNDHKKFTKLASDGALVSPDEVALRVAQFLLNPKRELSGKFVDLSCL